MRPLVKTRHSPFTVKGECRVLNGYSKCPIRALAVAGVRP